MRSRDAPKLKFLGLSSHILYRNRVAEERFILSLICDQLGFKQNSADLKSESLIQFLVLTVKMVIIAERH